MRLIAIILLSFVYAENCNPNWYFACADNEGLCNYSSTFTARVQIDGVDQPIGQLAAYVNNELRGFSAEAQELNNDNDYAYGVQIWAPVEEGDLVTFKFYNNNGILFNLNETYNFIANDYIGDINNPFIFTNLSQNVCDIDGNVYETVQIGDQLWMKENLKVTHYNNGDDIPTGYNNNEWVAIETGAYSFYNNDTGYINIYGNLYNWHAVNDDRNICPENWHIPSNEEFISLTNFLGGDSIAGGKMKQTGYEYWNFPNTGATNESDFTGIPGGYRSGSGGIYYYKGEVNYLWTSTPYDNNSSFYRELIYNAANIGASQGEPSINSGGFSVRCIADETSSGNIYIPQDYPTIQEGINAAADGDTVFVAAGTYYENIIWPSTNGIKLIGSGQDDCFIDGGVQEQCPGWGLDNTTYMCNEGQYNPSYSSVIRFLKDGDPMYGCSSDTLSTSIDSSTVISGFTIQNGYGDSTPWNGGGGGMQIWHSSPTLVDLTFSNNDGVSGGAMYICNSNSTITNVVFNENTIMIPDESGGAGIYVEESSLSLTDVVFSNNFDGGTNGGAIHIANWDDENMNLTLTNAVFINNYSGSRGGALYVDMSAYTEGSLTLTNVQFIGNQSYTGAVHIQCVRNATLTNVEFIDNIAHTYSAYWDSNDGIPSNYCDVGLEWNPDECNLSNNIYWEWFFPGYGGGLSLYDAYSSEVDSLIMSNVLFQGNSAARGGGMYGGADYLSITNATFVDNIAYGNPYTDARYGAFSGEVDNLTNTIMWNNIPDAMSNGSGIVNYSNIQGGEDWGEGNIDTDPLFVDPENGDYTLQSTSPCIDAGDPESPLDPDGTIADMGAYYYHQTFIGDLNSDAIIDVSDIIILIEIVLCIFEDIMLSDEQLHIVELQLGDIYPDGQLNIVDIVGLVNIILEQ